MKKIVIAGITALALILILGVSMAYQGNPLIQGPNYSEDRHAAMQVALDGLDYNSWYTLMTVDGRNPRAVQVVNEDNFAIFVQAHEAMESGDLATAQELRSELGLNNGTGPKNGTGSMNKSGHKGMGQRNNQNCPYAN